MNIEELKGLMARATQGEWGHASDAKSGYIQASDKLDPFKAPWAYYPEATVAMFPRHPVDRIADAILCVELHNALPALIERLEAAEGALRKIAHGQAENRYDHRLTLAQVQSRIADAHLARYGKE